MALDIIRPSEIKDGDTLLSVLAVPFEGHRTLETCRQLPRVWDDGFGPVWGYYETMGLLGVVRAPSWEAAWSCTVDEIMDDADEDDVPDADGNLPEGCHYRDSGIPSSHGFTNSIAREDINGNELRRLPEREREDANPTGYYLLVDREEEEEEVADGD